MRTEIASDTLAGPSTGHYRYWGEADPASPGEPKWRPLVYHCLDVVVYLVLEQ